MMTIPAFFFLAAAILFAVCFHRAQVRLKQVEVHLASYQALLEITKNDLNSVKGRLRDCGERHSATCARLRSIGRLLDETANCMVLANKQVGAMRALADYAAGQRGKESNEARQAADGKGAPMANGWISVKERLPEFCSGNRPRNCAAISDYVLAYDGERKEMVVVAWSRWDCDGHLRDMWADTDLRTPTGYDAVTHWMSLAEPPGFDEAGPEGGKA